MTSECIFQATESKKDYLMSLVNRVLLFGARLNIKNTFCTGFGPYGTGGMALCGVLTCWLVAMVKVVMGMAIGTACMACWVAGVLSGMTGATSGLHWIVPGEMMVAKVGLEVGRMGRPPYSGFSWGGRAMSMWSDRSGAGAAVSVGGLLWIIKVSVVVCCVFCCKELLILFVSWLAGVGLHICGASCRGMSISV